MILIIIISVILLFYLSACLALYLKQERLIFLPEKLDDNYKFHFATPFEEITLTPKDAKLNALWFKATNPKGIILYLHGNAGSNRTWGTVAEQLSDAGFDVFIYDYRTYGKSKGKLSEAAMYSDAQFAYNHLRRYFKQSEIIVYGRSLGSGFAAYLAKKNNPRLLILETPYYSMRAMAELQMPVFPVSLLLRYAVPTHKFLRKVKCPVLIFHGTADELIPYRQSLKLKSYLKKADKYITIQGGTHGNLAEFPEYSQDLKSFIEKYS
ncbi:MAG: alpha/beta hydrolase [Cytophagaceae bacterium]